MVLGLTVVGVPVISPVRGFILNPAGKEGAEKRCLTYIKVCFRGFFKMFKKPPTIM
jgi:hypothetical protein